MCFALFERTRYALPCITTFPLFGTTEKLSWQESTFPYVQFSRYNEGSFTPSNQAVYSIHGRRSAEVFRPCPFDTVIVTWKHDICNKLLQEV